eukprot:CAMPEP_0179217292 /NCGR_PEP_ID=MMETSP0797-20121207/3843_1 /TAXON_ID=47934 /ORGANISM="Dinophysis acuminata, Strain DAEP01" /LENGTH=230 /DNA_ID=CAMNT_0020923525 /DNA_START=17 /DNA_END=706 /DNA_ORIENTATION=-
MMNCSDTVTIRCNKPRHYKSGKLPIPEHSGIYRLHIQAQVTLNTKVVQEAVLRPEGVGRDEWIASQVLMVYEEVIQVVNVLEGTCTERTCPSMNAGKRVEYKWSDQDHPRAIVLPAQEYMAVLLDFAYDILSNPYIVPNDGSPFPPSFRGHMTKLLKRMFRVYAHAYICHFETVRAMGAEGHLNCCFKHFLFFVLHFDLVDRRRDMLPLKELIAKFEAASPLVTGQRGPT